MSRSSRTLCIWIAILSVTAVTLWTARARAFERYNDGCNNAACHGAFTDATTPKGSVFPGNSKHTMHRSNQAMNTECDLCHSAGDGNNPFTGSSDGTNDNPGLGCTGCHDKWGLRAHHPFQVIDCSGGGFCHNTLPAPPESEIPPYYGTADTLADDPCNSTQQEGVGENWTIGDFIGLDNDGDDLYDGDDPDCAVQGQTPGEIALLTVAAHDVGAGQITVDYGTACESTDNTIEHGPLSQVSSYGYNGQQCNILNNGTADWLYPMSSTFFVVVANNGTVEGSYGQDSSGVERPEDATSTSCVLPQDLADSCN